MLEIFKVATKALIINNENQILLIYKSDKDDVNPNDYDIPWWRLQFGEKADVCLQREIHEELGIQVEIGKPNRVRWYIKENTHLVGITFMAKYTGGEIRLSFEHTKYMRKTKEEILAGEFPDRLKNEVNSI